MIHAAARAHHSRVRLHTTSTCRRSCTVLTKSDSLTSKALFFRSFAKTVIVLREPVAGTKGRTMLSRRGEELVARVSQAPTPTESVFS